MFIHWLTIEDVLAIKKYISDEQWYVPASVNTLRIIFNTTPHAWYNKTHLIYTLVLGEKCSRQNIANLVKHGIPGSMIYKDIRYNKINAIVVVIPANFSSTLRGLSQCVRDVVPGILPDESNINTYMNLEHPPLVKYLIGLSILLGSLNNFYWRLPSIIAGFIIIIVVAIILHMLSRRLIALYLLSMTILVASIIYDETFRSMTSIAMLDVFVSLFTMLSLLFMMSDRILLSSIMVGLAGSSKMTGFFAIPWLYVVLRLKGYTVSRAIRYSILVPLLVYLIVNMPLIIYYGPQSWLNELYSALKWHITSRPPGPPSTDPLGLILSRNPFPLYYLDGIVYLIARCNPGICVTAFVVSWLSIIIMLDFIARRLLGYRWMLGREYYPLILYVSIWLGYLGVYLAGNHTLYSFYTIHFQPLGALIVALMPHYLNEYLVRPFSSLAFLITNMRKVVKAYIRIRELSPLMAIAKSPSHVRILIILLIYMWSMILFLFHIGFYDNARLSIFSSTCVHRYGFNPLNSFICVSKDSSVSILLILSSLILFLFYFYRFSESWLEAQGLILYSPIVVLFLTSDISNMFSPIYLAYLKTPYTSVVEGFILGFFSPNPILAFITHDFKTLIGFLIGQFTAQLFIFLQAGIDFGLQMTYYTVYLIVGIMLWLLRIKVADPRKVLPWLLLTALVLVAPSSSLLGLYVVLELLERRGLNLGLGVAAYILLPSLLYINQPSLGLNDLIFTVVEVLLVIPWLLLVLREYWLKKE